jgi:hypothetical protein
MHCAFITLDINCKMMCYVWMTFWTSPVEWSYLLCLHHMLNTDCGMKWCLACIICQTWTVKGVMCCVCIICMTPTLAWCDVMCCACITCWTCHMNTAHCSISLSNNCHLQHHWRFSQIHTVMHQVTRDGVWIGNWVSWTLTNCNYN